MFQETYNFFGRDLSCITIATKSRFKLESDSYPYIKRQFNVKGWKVTRVETVAQDGFPDILLLRGKEYCLMEVKRLKKKKLKSIENDLTFQFGQLPFMQRSFSMNFNYILTVVKDNHISYISTQTCLNSIIER